MKRIFGVLVAIAAVLMLVVMMAGRRSGEQAAAAHAAAAAGDTAAASTGTATSAASAPVPDLDKVLVQIANRTNATLPMMVDRNTRWDTTMGGPGKNFTYFYTMPGHASAALDAVTREAIGSQVTGNVCGNKDMQLMFQAGVTVHYVYRGNDGVEVVRLDIPPADCGITPDPSFNPQSLFGAV